MKAPVENMRDETDLSFGFGRELRLLSPQQFSFVFEEPTRCGNRAFTLLARQNNQDHARLGMAIAKKHLKLAVARNQIKRKLRESFRLTLGQLPHFDFVILVRRDIAQMGTAEIDSAIAHLWRKVKKQCVES